MRTTAAAALILLASSISAEAAIRYKFKQVARSDYHAAPAAEISGEVIIDGDKSRVEFPGRSPYGENTYVISHNGAKNVFIVDPQKKTVAEVNVANVAAALASSSIEVSNLKSQVKKLPDQIEIAGVPTEHYRIEMSYDVSVRLASIPLKQRVQTTIDRWTTEAFGPVSDIFLSAGSARTGNAQLDQIIELESSKVKGLVLRQTVSIVTTNLMERRAPSQLELSPSRRQSSEMLVTDIRVVNVDSSAFNVPNYPRVNRGEEQQPKIHELSMQPAN